MARLSHSYMERRVIYSLTADSYVWIKFCSPSRRPPCTALLPPAPNPVRGAAVEVFKVTPLQEKPTEIIIL